MQGFFFDETGARLRLANPETWAGIYEWEHSFRTKNSTRIFVSTPAETIILWFPVNWQWFGPVALRAKWFVVGLEAPRLGSRAEWYAPSL